MADIVFILVVVVFFALCVAYVRGLDRLVRASEEVELARTEMTPRAEVTR
jgi:hypothetical protein